MNCERAMELLATGSAAGPLEGSTPCGTLPEVRARRRPTD